MNLNACTRRLGDSIHAYAVTLAMVQQGDRRRRFRARTDYAGLFVSGPLQVVRQRATWWCHDGSFHGPRHGQHVRDTMAACAGVRDADLAIRLSVTSPPHAGDYMVICPHVAAHAAYKEWPLERWAAIAEVAAALGSQVFVCGMPGRKPLQLPASATSLMLDAVSLAAWLAGARALLGPDSGHIHLADALGTPVIGLYAATSTLTYGPYRDQRDCIDHHRDVFPTGTAYDSSRHVRTACMQTISIDEVAGRIRATRRLQRPRTHT